MIMCDGLQGGVEGLTDKEVDAASDGSRYFGFREIAELIQRAKPYRHRYDEDLEAVLEGLDREYAHRIPSDDALVDIVERRLREHPGEFAPT
jgi:hypothetical protein